MMTPFIPLLTVTSLYEVFIEGVKYDDTFHTSANTSYSEVTSRGVKGVIMLHPLNKYFIQ
jgi:hypothetical protein